VGITALVYSSLRGRGWAVLLVAAVAGGGSACGHSRSPRDPTVVSTQGEPPAFPGDFTPGAPLTAPAPGDPAAFGATYLDGIYPAFRDGWAAFLEDIRLRLPPSHPLNSPTLEATLLIVANKKGEVIDVQVQRPSGNDDFDQAARDVARDAGPFPAPSRDLLSDDDRLYLTWLFARDQRQAGLATAKVTRIEWALDRAVTKFLDGGDLAAASARVAAAASAATSAAALDPVLVMADRLFLSAIREALRSPDPAVQRVAIAAAAEARLAAAGPELRTLAETAADVANRAAALEALGAIKDVGAAPMTLAALERDAGATAEVTAAAAAALAAMGKGADAGAVVERWLTEGRPGQTASQKARTWAALIALRELPMPSAVPELDRLTKAGDPRVAAAACTALGTTASASAEVWKSLRKGLDDADASVRAACARGAATAAERGSKSRSAFWRSAELLRDRDERVRAGAVRAAARIDPARAAQELQVLAREKSPPVLIALTAAWGAIGPAPQKQLTTLAGHPDPAVRAAAVAALAARSDDTSRAAAAARAVDPDPRVRVAAVPAVRDPAQLVTLAEDSAPEVRSAAVVALAKLRGRRAILVEQTQAVAAAPPASPERVSLALGWFLAR
jgi:TonB family protein